MDYEILEHTADLKIKVYGKDKPELFINTLKAMFESIRPEFEEPEIKIERELEINSSDLPSLLVDFLSEALYLSNINNEAYFFAEFEKLTETELKGKIFGQKINGFQKEIKAITYHNLEIKKVNKYWEVIVLFDI